ncbi:MAG: ATP-binding protein [Vicinamibacterales bacterium]
MFERFFRGSNAIHRGSGLGLAIVRQIEEDHSGTITVESVVGAPLGTLSRGILCNGTE